MDVDQKVNYMHSLLRGLALKKYKTVLTECKELAKDIAGYQWTLKNAKDVTIELFCTWEKVDGIFTYGDN